MYCNQCGTQLAENARFCFACGHQIAENPNSGPSLTPPRPQKSKNEWAPISIISGLVIIIIVVFVVLAVSEKERVSKTVPQTTKASTIPTPTPNNTLCSGDSGPMSSGKIDQSHPLQQDDGQAAQGDQGGFSPVSLCNQIATSDYAITFHAKSPYISLYLYDAKHSKYEIDYQFYSDHVSVVSYPGFSTTNSISVGQGTFSSADWHTYQIEFKSNTVRVLIDEHEVLSGSAGFTDDGIGDHLLLQSHQITMDQFSVTSI